MNIVMMTNTFTPHVGGVARSVSSFTEEYRRRGHRVLVVAPQFPGTPQEESDVVRVPAIQNFNGSDFSMVLPVFSDLDDALDQFNPDLIHSHHPYLLGMTALREARTRNLPLVFTHHTLYEHYTHYVPVDSPAFKRFVIELATRYANLCDEVFAPSGSIKTLLQKRGVKTPIEVLPTGVDVARFAQGDGLAFRRRLGIPESAFVVGHLGRLAPEKNLDFLAEAVCVFLHKQADAHFIIAGSGPCKTAIEQTFTAHGLTGRLHMADVLIGRNLVDAYHAMDVFAFASKTETQGLVLVEAMAAQVPIVALDATGSRDVVKDKINGRLVKEETVSAFVEALQWIVQLPSPQRNLLKQAAADTAREFSLSRTAETALQCYEELIHVKRHPHSQEDYDAWVRLQKRLQTEWHIIKQMAEAAGKALTNGEPLIGR